MITDRRGPLGLYAWGWVIAKFEEKRNVISKHCWECGERERQNMEIKWRNHGKLPDSRAFFGRNKENGSESDLLSSERLFDQAGAHRTRLYVSGPKFEANRDRACRTIPSQSRMRVHNGGADWVMMQEVNWSMVARTWSLAGDRLVASW